MDQDSEKKKNKNPIIGFFSYIFKVTALIVLSFLWIMVGHAKGYGFLAVAILFLAFTFFPVVAQDRIRRKKRQKFVSGGYNPKPNLQETNSPLNIIDNEKKLIQKNASKEVEKYCQLILNSTSFPDALNYNYYEPPTEMADAFRELIISKVSVSEDAINFEIERVIAKLVSEKFRKRLLKRKPDLFQSHNPVEWIDTYLAIFQLDDSFLDRLRTTMIFEGSFSHEDISERDLRTMLYSRSDEKKMESNIVKLKTLMDSGGSFGREVNILDIDSFAGLQFEAFLETLFTKMGYHSIKTKASGDQGADLVLEKAGKTLVVQAKRYTGSVGNDAVQQVVAAKAYYNAHEGAVITNSVYTKSAKELAAANDIKLWDRSDLEKFLVDFPTYDKRAS